MARQKLIPSPHVSTFAQQEGNEIVFINHSFVLAELLKILDGFF